MNANPIAVMGAARTPFAKAFTDLRSVSALKLGVTAVTGALRHCGLQASEIDEVVLGNVAGPPDAANIARVVALKSGIPQDRIAHTVNRNCASAMEAILGGWQAIESGRANIVVVGGTESMSNIPLLVSRESARRWMALARAKSIAQKLRVLASFRPSHFKPVLGIELGLTDPVSGLNMGETAEILADEFAISREAQDQYAVQSHQKAEAAQRSCFLSGEIVPVALAGVGAEIVQRDNAIRYEQMMASLAKLRPIFAKRDVINWEGTVTPGNSCPLTDGAIGLVLARSEQLDRFGSPPLGYITAASIAGCDPRRMGLGPVYATAKLLAKTGLQLKDFDLFEINEAFAAQVVACLKAMSSKKFAADELARSKPLGDLDPDRLNVHGGAIALGHPVGATAARLVVTLLRALRAAGQRRGLATLCVGGGQGMAMMVQTEMEQNK